MKKRFSILTLIICVIFSSVFSIIGYNFLKPQSNLEEKISEINSIVLNNFDGTIDAEKLEDEVLTTYVSALGDKYSSYITLENSSSYNNNLKGEGEGFGIEVFKNKNGYMQVNTVYENSPADKSGIKSNDVIIKIDEQNVTAKNYNELYNYITNKNKGDIVKFTIIRDNKTINIEVTKDYFVKQTIFYEVIDNLGYIKITHFTSTSVESFNLAINSLLAKNVKALIFDVRSNSGGTVDSVSKMLDSLLPECDIISVKYKNATEKVLHKSDAKEINLPMAVLVNEQTASASELFAASLREIKNSKIFGKTTYGKGKMQTIFNLKDGSLLKLTVASFYSPNKNNWDGVGIKPDFEIESDIGYYVDAKSDPVVTSAIKYLNK